MELRDDMKAWQGAAMVIPAPLNPRVSQTLSGVSAVAETLDVGGWHAVRGHRRYTVLK